jgi:hypothetical protein
MYAESDEDRRRRRHGHPSFASYCDLIKDFKVSCFVRGGTSLHK